MKSILSCLVLVLVVFSTNSYSETIVCNAIESDSYGSKATYIIRNRNNNSIIFEKRVGDYLSFVLVLSKRKAHLDTGYGDILFSVTNANNADVKNVNIYLDTRGGFDGEEITGNLMYSFKIKDGQVYNTSSRNGVKVTCKLPKSNNGYDNYEDYDLDYFDN